MKHLLPFCLLGLFNFNEPKHFLRKSKDNVIEINFNQNYCFVWVAFKQKTTENQVIADNVMYISYIIDYQCSTTEDCSSKKNQMINNLKAETGNVNLTRGSFIPECFDTRQEAENYRSRRIKAYTGYNYKIVEVGF